ncbi:MAG: lysophospholipid acyltransferase family protein [Kiloniellales bacterium]
MACWLVSLYIRLVYATGRWRYLGTETRDRMAEAGAPFILCFWHGRILMMPYAWRRRDQVHMLISAHIDGQLIARTVGHFGIKTIAGSSSKGGGEAIRAMLKVLRNRQWVGITPDGPRGPRMRASAGIVTVARMAGVPIIPITFGAARSRTLGSWDRFSIPLPLCRGVFIWGPPIEVAHDADEAAQERARRRVEEELNRITWEADRLCGRPAVEPAPAPCPAAPRPAGKERLRAAG